MKKIWVSLFFALAFTGSALAQGNQCRTSPVGASTPNCASEAFVTESVAAAPGGTVTSVGLTNTYGLNVSGSPVTSAGNISAGVTLSTSSNSLGSDVAMNNSSYTDGPSMAQGTSGTWYVVGNINVEDTGGGFQASCKLWDGTTIIDSRTVQGTVALDVFTAGFAGFISSPAANIRISCKSNNASTTSFKFNASGNSKDSTISGIRIQ